MNTVKVRRNAGKKTPAAIGAGVAVALLVALPAAAGGSSDTATGATENNVFGIQRSATADALANISTGPNVAQAVEVTSERSKARAEAKARKAAEKRAAEKRAAEKRAAASNSSASTAPAASGKRIPTSNYNLTARYGQSGGWSRGYHTGLDFAAPTGTPVVAAMSGTVVSAGWEGAYGNAIVIQHANGVMSRYAHLSSISVGSGQSVGSGAQIGSVGSTGNSTGPHLHFEVMTSKDSGFMDPWAWLNS